MRLQQNNTSIIIPVRNEAENVDILLAQIKQTLANNTAEYEVIFVNDGSTDGTQSALEEIQKNNPELIKIIEFRKNFGKADAYQAGFELCSGDLIFTMDGDLQDDPNDMPKFLEQIDNGYDVVVGWKFERYDSKSKILQSRLFNFILRHLVKIPLHDFDNGYRCMKREVLNHLHLYEGMYRYIPVFADAKGFKITEVKVNHRPRKFGKSKYGFSRLGKGFFDLIALGFISIYFKKPLHFFGGIGGALFLIGFSAAFYLSYLKIFLGEPIGNRPLLLFSALLMIIGIQLIFFGLIGEMIANISKKEKNYSIKKILK